MPKKIFLLSDQVIHWNFVPTNTGKNVYSESWGNVSTKILLDAISSFFDQNDLALDWSLLVDPDTRKLENTSPTDQSINHLFATWRQYNEGKRKAWRIQEIIHVGQSEQPPIEDAVLQNAKEADLVMIQDWGMSIRNDMAPGLGDLLRDKWVIFRGFPPLFEGNLWQEIQKNVSSKGVFILRADDLRKLNTSISKGLSWEQTIQDVVNEIVF